MNNLNVAKFLEELKKHDFRVVPGGGRCNLFKVATPLGSIVLYVKESNSNKGFWGLTKKLIDQLKNEQCRWFVVLLRSFDCGYLLQSGDVIRKIEKGVFKLARDENYKINERVDLRDIYEFHSFQSVVGQILNS